MEKNTKRRQTKSAQNRKTIVGIVLEKSMPVAFGPAHRSREAADQWPTDHKNHVISIEIPNNRRSINGTWLPARLSIALRVRFVAFLECWSFWAGLSIDAHVQKFENNPQAECLISPIYHQALGFTHKQQQRETKASVGRVERKGEAAAAAALSLSFDCVFGRLFSSIIGCCDLMKNYVHNFQIYRCDPLTTCTTIIEMRLLMTMMLLMMLAVGALSNT